MLARKLYLINELEESKYNADRENLDHNSYKFMLDRLRGQKEYELVILRELDPYFQFQDKIQTKLVNIKEDKETRNKIKESRLKQIKQ